MIVDQATVAAPQSLEARAIKGLLAVNWKGDPSLAEKQFSMIPAQSDSGGVLTWLRAWILTLKRKFPEALQIVQQFRGETLATNTTAPLPKAFLEGQLYFHQGDKEKARIAFEHARPVAERLVGEAPQDPTRHGQLGLIFAVLGEKEKAIDEGKRAIELLPESQDAFDGPQATEWLARIYAWTGDFDQAFRLLDHLLTIPNFNLSVPLIKLDPSWDPLRKDPRFQKLCEEKQP